MTTLAPKKEYTLPETKNRYQYTEDVKLARELGLATKWTRNVHIHLLDGKPLKGASSVKRIVGDKDNLHQHYADMGALAGLASPQLDIKDEYAAVRAVKDWKEKAKQKKLLDEKYPTFAEARRAAKTDMEGAADKGTDRHARLEDYVKLCIQLYDGKPGNADDVWADIKPFVEWAKENVEQFYFSEANGYHEPMWTGGICDIGLKLKDGRRVIGDFKSSQSAFPDMYLQTALYDLLLNHSGGLDREGNKLFEWELADGYVIFPFRSEPFTPEFRWNAEDWRKAAKFTVFLYNLMEINN